MVQMVVCIAQRGVSIKMDFKKHHSRVAIPTSNRSVDPVNVQENYLNPWLHYHWIVKVFTKWPMVVTLGQHFALISRMALSDITQPQDHKQMNGNLPDISNPIIGHI